VGSHSELLLQDVRQAVAPQVYGEQSVCTIAGHCLPPLPGQLACAVATPFVQEAARQVVVDDEAPSVGQVVDEPLHDSAMSQPPVEARQTLVSSVHVPVEQLWQSLGSVPPQAELQQVPSTQKLLVHSLAALQLPPFGFLGAHVGAAQ
jgi:hypothetical protein